MKNIFIEGIQGMGKSTLLQALYNHAPGYQICREGDYSPVELAWCTWMTETEYVSMLERYPSMREEIRKNTIREDAHYIVTYTKILTDIPGFHKDLERFEIYNGRKSLTELEQIIMSRYRKFSGEGYLFECAFMQNIVEDLILFHQLNDEEIVAFYHKLYANMQKENFLLIYLYSDKIDTAIEIIRKERSDNLGNEFWYPLMMEYFRQSPYGKKNNLGSFDDLVAHLRHRQQIELRIIEEVIGKRAIILPAKKWKIEDVEVFLNGAQEIRGAKAKCKEK